MADLQHIILNQYTSETPIGSSVVTGSPILTDLWTVISSSINFTVSGKTAIGGSGHLGDIQAQHASRGGVGVVGGLSFKGATESFDFGIKVFFRESETDSSPILSSIVTESTILTDLWINIPSSVTYTVSGKTAIGGSGHLGDIQAQHASRGGVGVVGDLGFKLNVLLQTPAGVNETSASIVCVTIINASCAIAITTSSIIVGKAVISATPLVVIGGVTCSIICHAVIFATNEPIIYATSTIIVHGALTAFPTTGRFTVVTPIIVHAIVGPGAFGFATGAIPRKIISNFSSTIVGTCKIVAFTGLSCHGVINGCYPYLLVDHWTTINASFGITVTPFVLDPWISISDSTAFISGGSLSRGGSGHLGDLRIETITQNARGGSGHLADLRPPICTPACIINVKYLRVISPIININGVCNIFAHPASKYLASCVIIGQAVINCYPGPQRIASASLICAAGVTVAYTIPKIYGFPINIIGKTIVNIANYGFVTPVPIITSIIPDSVFEGSADTTILIDGLFFDPTCIAQWVQSPPVPLVTTYINSTQLLAVIPSDLLAVADIATIFVYKTVTFPDDGIVSSNGYPFTVVGPSGSGAGSLVRQGDTSQGQGSFPPAAALGGSSNVKINSRPTIRVGDSWSVVSDGSTSHGATSIQGSPTIFVNGEPAVRIGDSLSDGDQAASGSPNVIGD